MRHMGLALISEIQPAHIKIMKVSVKNPDQDSEILALNVRHA